MYPIHVEINEKKILKLSTTLKRAYRQITRELLDATDFGTHNRQVILAQVDRHLEDLGVDIDNFLREELPDYYKKGADQAIAQLRKTGAPLEVTYGFNSVHIEAIQALIDDTSKAFGETLTGISRSANRVLGRGARELITQKMAEGTISGKAMREVKQQIKGIIQDEGLAVLKDKAGRSWSLDRYSEMLLRTKSVEARNRGLINRVVENKFDLVQVSDHMGECELCRPWEGKILSLTGATKGYPTVAEAEAEGLFHPNCRHAINALVPDLAKETNAYDPDKPTKKVSVKNQRELAGLD